MKEEIENILGNINFEVETEQEWLEPLGLDRNTWKQILNYITNLQQENKQLKDKINKALKMVSNEKYLHIERLEKIKDILGDKE